MRRPDRPRAPRGLLAVTTALAAALAVGCSSSSGGAVDGGARNDAAPTADAGPPTAADYCEATAGLFCDFYLRCGRMLAADDTECRAVFVESCEARYQPRYVDLEAAGLLALSADGIAACEAHLATVACDAQPLDLDGPCRGMWVGAQPAGGACGLDVESFVCAPGTTCVLDLSLCGACAATAPLDASCDGATCADEAFCDEASTCQLRATVGTTCSSELPCRRGLRCVEGTCAAPTYVGEDAACDASRRCPYRATCIDGTCRKDALLGEPCGATTACASGRCVADTCAPFAAAGEPCASGADCATGLCDDAGRCAPLPSACF